MGRRDQRAGKAGEKPRREPPPAHPEEELYSDDKEDPPADSRGETPRAGHSQGRAVGFLYSNRYWVAVVLALVYVGIQGTLTLLWWNSFSIPLFVMTLVLFFRARPEDMEALAVSRQFLRRDGGRLRRLSRGLKRLPVAPLVMAMGGAYALLASAFVLPRAAELQPDAPGEVVAQCIIAVVSAWLVIHASCGTYYANLYYRNIARGKPGGIEFPGEEPPDYLDFWQFACSIGTGSGASLTVTNRGIRRATFAHQLYSFAFNSAILALTFALVVSFLVG